MAQIDLKAVISAQDNTKSGLTSVEKGFDSLRGSVNNLGKAALDTAKVGLAGLTAGIAGLAVTSIKTASSFQQQRVALETFTGSAEIAGKLLSDITNFAKKTPFELSGVIEGTKRLMAFGVSATDVLTDLKSLGNIAAGVGMDKLPQLILAFGQVKAATKLTGMELRQFTEAGVPLLDELAKQTGKTAAQIKEDMEAGAAPSFEAVREALAALSGEGGRFNNLMEAQSKTLSGTISNLKDSFTLFGLSVAGVTAQGEIIKGGFFDKVNNAAQNLYSWIGDNQTKLNEYGQSIGNFLSTSGQWLIDKLRELSSFWKDNKDWIESLAKAIGVTLVTALKLAAAIFGTITDAINAMGRAIGTTIEYVKRLFSSFKSGANSVGEGVASSLANLVAKLLPGRASGGPVTSGKPYIVGEKGPELFVPSQNGGIIPNNKMGAQVSVNFYGNINNTSNASLDDIGSRIARQIQLAAQGI